MALPISPNLNLANTETLNNRGQAEQGGGAGGEGFRNSIIQNFALGASRIDAAATAATGIPAWVWVVLVGAGVFFLSLVVRRKG